MIRILLITLLVATAPVRLFADDTGLYTGAVAVANGCLSFVYKAAAEIGELDEAEREYQRAIYLQPGYWPNHHYLAQIFISILEKARPSSSGISLPSAPSGPLISA